MRIFHALRSLVFIAGLGCLLHAPTSAAVVRVNASIVDFALVSGTQTFSFTDGVSGESVSITLVAAAVSNPVGGSFTLLDSNTHLGVQTPSSTGGNHVDGSEGVDFTAWLASASSGVQLSSISFSIEAMGLRRSFEGPTLGWSSSATGLRTFSSPDEDLAVMDTGFASIQTGTYTGSFRVISGGGVQLSNSGTLAGQSLKLAASFAQIPEPALPLLLLAGAGLLARRHRRVA